uniref:Solute carrier family 16 member 12 n=1 Tax=Hippocampus comes TaxID=109280 RepID=A0A3Q3DGJ4_HIPCM
ASKGQVTKEGGWGWMVVAACFLATICTRAVTRCVSIFFVEFQLHFGRDYSTTAWIHSLIDCTTMLCAPLGGFLSNRLSCRATIMLGGLLSSVGLVISCFASSLEHLYVSMSILTGFGFALSYTPSIAMVGRYFSKRKALAYGIAQSGSGIGTFILAPVVQFLIDQYSWRGALLILGGFVSNLCVCGALMRPVVEIAKHSEPLVNTKAPRGRCRCFQPGEDFGFLVSPDFLVLCLSFLFLAYGCSTPVVYLVPFALSKGVDHKQAAFIMSIFGISGIVGNVTFGWITDRKCLKRYRMLSYMLAVAVEGLSCLWVPFLHSFVPLTMFAVVYGYFDGAYVALLPVVTSDAVGSAYLTSALGVVYFLHGVPYLVSPPIGGWLVDVTGTYTATFLVSGASYICSAAVLAVAMLVRRACRSGPKALSPEHVSTSTVCHQDVI